MMENEAKINALIIDDKALLNKLDAQSRIEPMTRFLGEKFNLNFLSTLEEIPYISEKIHAQKIKVIFIDMYLGGATTEENQNKFLNCLDYINRIVGAYFPVVIYSNKFSETLGWYYDIYEKKCAVIDSFGLNEYDKSTHSAERIYDRVNAFYSYSVPQTNSDEIKILLLSDLQISDPDTRVSAKFQIVDRIVDALSTQSEIGNIDLIVILGDITYSGEVDQFILAEEWIEKLWNKLNFKKLYHSDFRKRLLLIPGNHDVNISLAALQNYHFRSDWKPRNNPLGEYLEYGLKPFSDFAYKMTGDANWNKFKKNKLNFINDDFKYLGLRFIHLNSIHELNHINKSYISFDTNLLEQMSETLVNDDSEIFKIFLSHNGFDDATEMVSKGGIETNVFHHKRVPKDKWDENIMAVGNWLNRQKKGYKIWLKGHTHIASSWQPYTFETDVSKVTIENMKLRVVGTPTLGGLAIAPKSVNCFDVLKLKREKGKINSYKLFAFHEVDTAFQLRKAGYTDLEEHKVK